ncbi:SAVED domain-containing protein [Amycolatopsis mongoliensis]|uniref:SAVED domain-containing protein n=1 Tax=Amycolatopsis mongoliensis TaxID=715475 RepID=A0A9Y2JQK9_9PSEU|nr:SAVED domain-containing protein [Amycolatopsis sp. 4-36]WIY01836.1 SAVED domain-containing protein [Amycolatopsis sp. 4-36]
MVKASPSATRAIHPDGTSRAIPERIARRVWVAAGGRCSMCNRYLADEEFTSQDVMVGQLAHIVGWTTAAGSPRGSAPLPVGERNLADNLILLCHDQHKVVDDRSLWETYDTETLRGFKRRHERRIRKLTGLADDRSTTVLRVVGDLHGRPVDLTNAKVTASLLDHDRFPDWTLLGDDEYEIDLRALPGEQDGTTGYWSAAWEHLEDRLQHLRTQVRRGRISHISVFALARIPILIALGTLLDETIPTALYPKRRDGSEGWGWTSNSAVIGFRVETVRTGNRSGKAAIILSVSGTVDPDRLPEQIDDEYTVYELTPESELPVPALINNESTLDNFSRAWRAVLARVEAEHPGAKEIAVFPAVPAAAAVSMGRHLMRAAHPPLAIYDRMQSTGTYQYTTSTSRTPLT